MTSNSNDGDEDMNPNHLGIRFEVIYKDVHLVEVRISAWNGSFGGSSDVYLGLDRLGKTAVEISGFPRNPADVREIMLDSHSGPGDRVSMRFYCTDSSGHASVDSTIESSPDAAGKIQSATLSLPIEASAVDSFVEGLHRLGSANAGAAILHGCPPPPG
jgi:hypothetical protein